MLFTIRTTHQPATDLGYLLHKNPSRVQSFDLTFGQAHVFYPEVSATGCTAALLLDVNPVGLVRRDSSSGFALEQYVNDRPYAASSFLSVAIAQVFGSALNGKCKERPKLADTPIPFEATVAALPCRGGGGEGLLRRLFEPLGYAVDARAYPLDAVFSSWGVSPYFTVKLSQTIRLQDLLSHLYVLIPVLNNTKHYFVGSDEIEKLLRHGEGWLNQHPSFDLITRRYLKHQRSLTREALARLVEAETPDVEAIEAQQNAEETAIEEKTNLHQQRLGTVLSVLKNSGAKRILDLGCGEGQLLALLLKEPQFSAILGMDVSFRALEIAAERLHLDQLPTMQRDRVQLIHGSLMYRDPRLSGFDAAAVVEVIEHLDPPRLAAFERILFEFARPQKVVLTTPNAEYNVKWEALPAGRFRHKDHRFEWTRAEFQTWGRGIAERFGYEARFLPIGDEDSAVGAPSQMGVFEIAK